MSGMGLDPVKVQQFTDGWKKHQEESAKQVKTIAAAGASGAAVGLIGGAPGVAIGAAVGISVGIGMVIYDKLSNSGFKGSR